jgi:hypothetical protein
MAKGRNAAAVNARLREQLAERDAQIRRMERALTDMTAHRDRLAAWKAGAEVDGLPSVMAERERADAARAAQVEAVNAERAHWVDLLARIKPLTIRCVKVAGELAPDVPLIVEGDIDAFAEAFGAECAEMLPGANRTVRRNLLTAGQVRATRARAITLGRGPVP